MMNEIKQIDNNVDQKRARWQLYVPLSIAAIIIAGMMAFSYYSSIQMINVYAPQSDAIMEVRINVAIAHLWFEELMGGDTSNHIETIYDLLDRADQFAAAMLNGGTVGDLTYISVGNEELKAEIVTVRQHLATFREAMQLRYETGSSAGVGSELDQLFDTSFEELLTQSEAVEEMIFQITTNELKIFKGMQIVLVIVGLATFAGITFILIRFERTQNMQLNAVREADQQTRAVMNNVADGLITLDENGIIETFNTAAEGIFLYDRSEMIGQPIKRLMPESLITQTSQAGSSHNGNENSILGTRRDGTSFPMELRVSEVELESKRLRIGMVRDITDRKRADDALRDLTSQTEQMAQQERNMRQQIESVVASYTDLVQRVADGDLTQHLDMSQQNLSQNDDLYQLGNHLNDMIQGLNSMAAQINETAAQVTASASEIQASTTQQSASATQQDVTVTETVATVEEVRATVAQTVERANTVQQASQQSIEVSRAGQEAVMDSIEGMEAIQQRVADIAENILILAERTQQIGEIIDTVNALADQSKLLALNASIEAARAGEEGKGFAVVAMEVRQLAEQSREATARVRDILSEIQHATNTAVMVTEEGSKVAESGVTLVARAGDTIHEMAQTIESAAQMAAQISASSEQQMNGMDQLLAAMQQIKQASTQTASSTMQAEQSSRNLMELARQLELVSSNYRL